MDDKGRIRKKKKRQNLPLKSTKILKSNMEIPAKIKAIPGQLRKASKLHAGQAEIMDDFLANFIKDMKKKNG